MYLDDKAVYQGLALSVAEYPVMSDRLGFLVFFFALLALGLYAAINPKAAKRENENVPGFYRTGFSWVPVWGFRLVGLLTIALSGMFLYLFLRHH